MPERDTAKDIARDTKWHEWTTNILAQLMDLNSRYESLSRQIAAKHDSLDKEMEEKFNELSTQIERTSHIVSGSSDPSKGLVIRVDRLEQSEARRSWWLKSTLAACVGAIVTAVFALFKRHGP